MTDLLPVILSQPSDRKHYTHEFKRQIVEASLVAGTSISGLALKYGINTNLVHKWRARYRHGAYGVVSKAYALATTQIVSPARLVETKPDHTTTINADRQSSDCIELFFNRTRVLVRGAPDSQTLRNIIDALRT